MWLGGALAIRVNAANLARITMELIPNQMAIDAPMLARLPTCTGSSWRRAFGRSRRCVPALLACWARRRWQRSGPSNCARACLGGQSGVSNNALMNCFRLWRCLQMWRIGRLENCLGDSSSALVCVEL